MSLDDYDFEGLAVDTNVFIDNKFDFSGKKLGLLKQYLDSDVEYLVPKVLYLEMLKHYEEQCKEERKIARAGLNSLAYFWEAIDNIRDLRNIVNNASHAKEKLDSFLADTGADVISCNDIDIDEMLSLYGEVKPPFEISKKDEFPDAIAVFALEKWAEENSTMVLFVSNDKGVKKYCDNSEFVKVTPSLAEAYEYYLRDNRIFARYILQHAEELDLERKISEELETYVNDHEVDPDAESYYYWELSEGYAEFSSFQLAGHQESMRVVEISDDDVVIEASGLVSYTVHAFFDLYQRDSIDRDYFKIGQAKIQSREDEYVEVMLSFLKDSMNDRDSLEIMAMDFSPIMNDLYYSDLEPDWEPEPEFE